MKYEAKMKKGSAYFLARLSYANVFEPKGFEGQEPKYSVSLLVPKNDQATIAVIKEGIELALEDGKERLWKGKMPKGLRNPMRDGDEDRADDENYADHFFLNANSKATKKPKLFTRVRGEVATEEDIYSGCYAVAIVNFYPYDTAGNRGVGCGLVGLQKFADGEKLSGSSVDEDELEFDDVDDVEDSIFG